MILRPYQNNLVSKAVDALQEHKNTLAVAATGAGKTIMLADLANRIGGKTLVLQHREELIQQNHDKFRLVNPKAFTSFVKANDKDYSGEAVFAMVQTLSRNGNLDKLPKFEHLIIDEAHHSVAESYIRIIERIKDLNPDTLLSGFTATPCRADKKGLRRAGFDNCCAEISTATLVKLGFLVPPKAYTHNLAGVDFNGVKKVAGEYDMDEVAEIMDVEIHNETIFKKWFELAGSKEAGSRKTIVFCSTVNHAVNVCMVFKKHGINAVTISGNTPAREREENLKRFSDGDIQVVCNCAVLTEGFDAPACSCVVLLRPCSAKSTMIQMIGRGLRIDTKANKQDCIVLDFGMSLATHGDLVGGGKKGLDDIPKICPSCDSKVPPDISECPICGYIWEAPEKSCPKDKDKDPEIAEDIEMIMLNILEQSPFKWADLFNTNTLLVATGFESSAYVVSKDGGINFVAIGKTGKARPKILQQGNQATCLSVADDFLRMNELSDAASKAKRWLYDYPSEKQLNMLKQFGYQQDKKLLNQLTKYEANCHLAFAWNRKQIENKLGVAA